MSVPEEHVDTSDNGNRKQALITSVKSVSTFLRLPLSS